MEKTIKRIHEMIRGGDLGADTLNMLAELASKKKDADDQNAETETESRPDWKENDPESKNYIANRPGGYNVTETFEASGIAKRDSDGYFYIEAELPSWMSVEDPVASDKEFEETLEVTFDKGKYNGLSYYFYASQQLSYGVIGNRRVLRDPRDASINQTEAMDAVPFALYSSDNITFTRLYVKEPGTHFIKIQKIVPIPLSVGTIASGAKDGVAFGLRATAEGLSNEASGIAAHAEGYQTTASGAQSHAEGTATTAEGNYSHAEGTSTTARNAGDHAEGTSTLASGGNSHSEGQGTTASGNAAHAEGSGSRATGASAHAEGTGNVASGSSSHAEGGGGATASESGAHAEGVGTTASGYAAHAEGGGTKAQGMYSHAEGGGTTASGTEAHAEGDGTTASGNNSHAEGVNTTASGNNSHSEGKETNASGVQGHAEGYKSKATGNSGHAEGYSGWATGGSSHAEGYCTTASGGVSHAEGYCTIAQKRNQHVAGSYNIADTGTNPVQTGAMEGAGSYVEIIGNGVDDNNRSNARTLDWSGNEWLAGTLKLGGSSASDNAAVDVLAAINNLTAAINTLNGDSSTVGSIAYKIAQALSN